MSTSFAHAKIQSMRRMDKQSKILVWPSERLSQVATPLPTGSHRENKELLDVLSDMDEALRNAVGGEKLGLAANQVGSLLDVAVVLGRVCINPRFTPPRSCPKNTVIEGCYSTVGRWKVERWPYGWCEWQDIDGVVHRTKENGLFGWVFQHEVEHLSGHSIEEHGIKLSDESP